MDKEGQIVENGMYSSDRCQFCRDFGEKIEPYLCPECVGKIQALGYRKPKGKPRLLSDEQLESLKAEYEGILEVEWHPTVFYLLDAISKAQWDICVKHYENS